MDGANPESARRRALVLVHEPGGGPAMVGRELAGHGFEMTEHLIVADPTRPSEHSPFPDTDGIDLLVVLGSFHSVYDTATIGAWIGHELDLIAACHRRRQPILGICFGGQALAAALGGRVELAPRAEIGWWGLDGVDRSPGGVAEPAGDGAGGDDGASPGAWLGGPWFEWHHDRFEVPAGAEVLATTGVGPQAFRLGRSLGLQFHPEVDRAQLAAWLADTDDDYLAGLGVDRHHLMARTVELEPVAADNCARLVRWFLGEVAGFGR